MNRIDTRFGLFFSQVKRVTYNTKKYTLSLPTFSGPPALVNNNSHNIFFTYSVSVYNIF